MRVTDENRCDLFLFFTFLGLVGFNLFLNIVSQQSLQKRRGGRFHVLGKFFEVSVIIIVFQPFDGKADAAFITN
jgi:hypothetical protein